MPGTRIFTLSLLAGALCAQTVYLPLDEGNIWVYRSDAGPVTVEAGRSAVFKGNQYRAVTGLSGGEAWARNAPEGRILVWDEAAQEERVLMDPAAPLKTWYATAMDPCNRRARIETREGHFQGPVGGFNTVLEVRYEPGPCLDAGLEQEEWLPWVGLLRRTAATLAGPRTYELVYARLGGVTFVSAPETGFTLSLIPSGKTLLVRLGVRHTAGEPLRLQFRTAQRFDFAIYDEEGRAVYQWSEGRAFPLALGSVEVRGEKTWMAEAPVSNLPPGRYAVHAWLTCVEGPVFAATALYQR